MSLRKSPRGFAAIFSIALIVIVNSTLVVMGRYFASDATRTASQQSEAQLRQLLTTGAVVAIARADHPTSAPGSALPPLLVDAGASLAVELTGEGDDRQAIVRAQFGNRRTEQTLQLHRTAGRWHVQ